MRTTPTTGALAAALAATMWIGCDASVADRLLSVDSRGSVFVFLYRDDNLNSTYNAGADTKLTLAQVDLRMRGARDLTPGGVTDTAGFRAFSVPVGRYKVEVATSVLGDSIEVTAGDSEFTVQAADSSLVLVALAYKRLSITQARALPSGRQAWVRGTVMNSPFMFGDSTVHLADDSAAIRTTGIRPNVPIVAGDSVLFLGRRATRDGQPTLTIASIQILGSAAIPSADSLSTAAAAAARGGAKDARLVVVSGATISDTTTTAGARVLGVSDGSGRLAVVLSPAINFGPLNQYVPGVVLDIVGLLVPDAGRAGTWVLKPRIAPDVFIRP